MKAETIRQLHKQFESISNHDAARDLEFWLARGLQELLGYTQWRNFEEVIEKAKQACEMSGHVIADHFADVSKMVTLGSGATREIEDVALTRYACYLIAQNGDPRKEPIAFAQTYFAVQTRKQEIIEQRLIETERLQARRKLTESEKDLSQLIFERCKDDRSFGRIRSAGDTALFGGTTTQGMKDCLKVPANRPLADFLPTITIKAKDFACEITNFNVRRDNLATEPAIATEHVKNNTDVRALLTDRHIYPERLPASEDIKKVERRISSEEKKLLKPTAKSHSKSRKKKI